VQPWTAASLTEQVERCRFDWCGEPGLRRSALTVDEEHGGAAQCAISDRAGEPGLLVVVLLVCGCGMVVPQRTQQRVYNSPGADRRLPSDDDGALSARTDGRPILTIRGMNTLLPHSTVIQFCRHASRAAWVEETHTTTCLVLTESASG
jgi:hypothetical protein